MQMNFQNWNSKLKFNSVFNFRLGLDTKIWRHEKNVFTKKRLSFKEKFVNLEQKKNSNIYIAPISFIVVFFHGEKNKDGDTNRNIGNQSVEFVEFM